MKGSKSPIRPRWRREWVVLSQSHIDFLDRAASDLGVTPSAIVRQLIEEAIAGESRDPIVTVSARFIVSGYREAS